jgi:pimeloyl-ACP methyl ester carboxylesterase
VPHTYTNGVVTFYEDAGEGAAVVLIHGYGADLRLWDQQAPALVDAGFRVIRYDVRGHGRSLIPPDGYTYENYSADLNDLLDRINLERPATESLGIGAAHVAGLSMGGGIALQFALDFPGRVLSLTLVDSALPGFSYSEESAGRIEALVDAVRADGPRSALANVWLKHPFFDGVRRTPEQFAQVREIVLSFQAPDMRDGARPPEYRPDIADRLSEVTAPALVVVGENDVLDFRLIADVLAENMPDARLVVMPDCWHLPPVEKPNEFNRLLIDFLRNSRA